MTAQLQVSVPLGTWTGCPSGYPRWLLRTSATVLSITPPALPPCPSLPSATVQYSAVPCACCVSARTAPHPYRLPARTASLPVLRVPASASATRVCCAFPFRFVLLAHTIIGQSPHPALPPPGHPLVSHYLQVAVTAAPWSSCQPASYWMAACTAATARSWPHGGTLRCCTTALSCWTIDRRW